MTSSNYHDLPQHIWNEVFSFCSSVDWLRMRLVSVEWNDCFAANSGRWFMRRRIDSRHGIIENDTLFDDLETLELLRLCVLMESEKSTRQEDFSHSLISRWIRASSTDDESQSILETRVRSKDTYWSSTGSALSTKPEYLIYSAKQSGRTSGVSVMELTQFSFIPFSASWQNHNIYAPKSVKLQISDDLEFKNVLYESKSFPVPHLYQKNVCNLDGVLVLSKIKSIKKYKGRPTRNFHDGYHREDIITALQELDTTDLDILALHENDRLNMINRLEELTRIRMEKNYKQFQEAVESEGEVYFRLWMDGRYQTQTGYDDLYYICIQEFDIEGRLYHIPQNGDISIEEVE